MLGQLLRYTGLKRFCRWYYVLNVLSIATYALARDVTLVNAGLNPSVKANILEWERNAFSCLAVLTAVKAVRAVTVDQFLADVFMFTKSVIMFAAYWIDVRLWVWYMILYMMLFLLVPQPFYEGPEDLVYLTPATYDELVIKQPSEKDKSGGKRSNRWLVECYASWSPPCVHLEPMFAQLSVKYGNSTLQFAKMDLGRWPRIAKELNVSLSGTSKQLPTLIMYENGRECARIPHIFADGSVAKGRYRKADLVKAFDLANAGEACAVAQIRKELKGYGKEHKKDKKSK